MGAHVIRQAAEVGKCLAACDAGVWAVAGISVHVSHQVEREFIEYETSMITNEDPNPT